MKKLCSHVLRSHLAIKKFEKFKFKKLRNLHFISFYLHCISFFGTVFQKNCTAPSQSELIEKFFHVYYSNSHNVYQTYEIDACCSLNLQKSSFNFTRELDIRIPGGYSLKRFCECMNQPRSHEPYLQGRNYWRVWRCDGVFVFII